MKFLPTFLLRIVALALCAAGLVFFAGCKRGGVKVLEVGYVSGVQVVLRDRVAAVFEKAGLVKNGERVEVLDHDRRFVKVRTETGQTGWMEQRFLVSEQVFNELQKLTAENANDPVQAQGVTRNDTNLHVEPGRDTEHLYQISAGEKLALLKRGTAAKPGAGAPLSKKEAAVEKAGATARMSQEPTGVSKGAPNKEAPGEKKDAAALAPPPALEDWWLVRDSHGRVGWVLGRMVDTDIPLEVAQYAEGQRIVAFFVLNQVKDDDKKVPQYLTVLTEPKDGLPFDFNQFRVFTWNVKRHRYETAYRERSEGMLPVKVGQEDFGKEGVLPEFTVRVLDDAGNVSERKYKLNTPMVRRVYAPGEEPVHAGTRKATNKSAAAKRRRKR